MAKLHVALEEGFFGEPVTVRVAGREVFSKPHVKTRMQIGLAESFETDIAEREAINPDSGEGGTIELEVVLPATGKSQTISLPRRAKTYVGISIGRDGELTSRVSPELFGYA